MFPYSALRALNVHCRDIRDRLALQSGGDVLLPEIVVVGQRRGPSRFQRKEPRERLFHCLARGVCSARRFPPCEDIDPLRQFPVQLLSRPPRCIETHRACTTKGDLDEFSVLEFGEHERLHATRRHAQGQPRLGCVIEVVGLARDRQLLNA
jgi:hypothetical protein